MELRAIKTPILIFLSIMVAVALVTFLILYSDRRQDAELPVSALTYEEVEDKASRGSRLTEAQRQEFLERAVGTKVRWTGEVTEVDSDFRVYVDIDGFLYDVEFPVSREVAVRLDRGQKITFVGIVQSVEPYLLSCRVVLRSVDVEEGLTAVPPGPEF